MLLHWCTLVPQNGLAAIRFTAPLRINSIRIFPDGTKPFSQCPEIISETQPDKFYVELMFNATSIRPPTSSEEKEKQHPANALIPTQLAYTGSLVDFPVDLGSEYATRLVIIKGSFSKLSIALYGELGSDLLEPAPVPYEPLEHKSIAIAPLAPSLDPGNASNPTSLAHQLLELLPEPPPLQLVYQLIFCLKPENDDWDLPEFPRIYADFSGDLSESTLEDLVQRISRPAEADVSSQDIAHFGSTISELAREKTDGAADDIAQLLSNAAAQNSDFVQKLLEHFDLEVILASQELDKDILQDFLNAAANVDIARKLNTELCVDLFTETENSTSLDNSAKRLASKVVSRVKGWEGLEDLLTTGHGDAVQCMNFLKDIGTEEHALGVWLGSTTSHKSIMSKLHGKTGSSRGVLPQKLWSNLNPEISLPDFLVVFKAFIGVASVLAVLSWADSVGHDECRARVLEIIRLWQSIDGYTEIVNHLLLVRQFSRRLEWITADNNPPRKSGEIGEEIILELSKNPKSFLHDDFVNTVLSLQPPLAYISEHERLAMRKVALVADDGLPAAVEELTVPLNKPLSARRLRTLRVALALVATELEDIDGEYRILQALWDEDSHGFVEKLAGVASTMSEDLGTHFALTPPTVNQTLTEQLLDGIGVTLHVLLRLPSISSLTSHCLRELTMTVANICCYLDAAMQTLPKNHTVMRTASNVKHLCFDFIGHFSSFDIQAEPDKPTIEVVLQSLLIHEALSGNQNPVQSRVQTMALLDLVLTTMSTDENIARAAAVLTSLLFELKDFIQSVPPMMKMELFRKLINLDKGEAGVPDWLLLQELYLFEDTLLNLSDVGQDDIYSTLGRYQVYSTLQFVQELMDPSSSTSIWCTNTISSSSEVADALSRSLRSLITAQYETACLRPFVHALLTHSHTFSDDLQFHLFICLLRVLQADTNYDGQINVILRRLNPESLDVDLFRLELGRLLSVVSNMGSKFSSEVAQDILSTLEWISHQDGSKLTCLSGITSKLLALAIDNMLEVLPPDRAETLKEIRLGFSAEEIELPNPEVIEIPSSLRLSIQSLDDILNPSGTVELPSTPKNGHKTPDVLGVLISPPAALLRSFTSTGLTKVYSSNEFRQLRQAGTSYQNTSRLPSMHVDVGIPVVA